MAHFKGERVESDRPTRKILFYEDTESGIKQISREIYKKIDKEIHYPRGFEGGEKYKTIRRFVFNGFKNKLPVGVVKSVNYGWGFTKTLNPFSFYLNDNYDLEEVIVQKGGETKLDIASKRIFLSEASLQLLQDSFSSIFQKNKAEVNHVLQINLNQLFPSIISKPAKTYISNALASSLSTWGNSIQEFSENDKKAIKDLFEKLSIGTDFLTSEALAKTKEIIDVKYVQETLKRYKALMALKTESGSLEQQWQEFLRDNSWIFSSIFAQPVILFKREAYVGGKTIDNQNGKFNDFLIKNSLSDNVSFLEIKTHKTKILDSTAYRGDDVYSATKDLTGSIAQVLNQRDNFQKEFYSIKGKSKAKEQYETFNSKCVVLIGSTKEFDINKKYSFELFRSNSKDVEILTFDELQAKIEGLQKLLTTK